ncbi:MAG: hypothetical protein MAG715_00690 [Methanonatronarchaeales archaeon]|nr:hypothetical protein [Methanonatronarchaeales archaeon]
MPEKISTGIDPLDELLDGGFRRGSSAVFYGPPGDGKSYVVWSTASCAARSGQSVLYFALHGLESDKVKSMENIAGMDFDLVDKLEFGTKRKKLSDYIDDEDVVIIDSLTDLDDGYGNDIFSDQFGEVLFETKDKGIVTVMSMMYHPTHKFPTFLRKVDYLVEFSEIVEGDEVDRKLFVQKTPRKMHERRYSYRIVDDEFVIEGVAD